MLEISTVYCDKCGIAVEEGDSVNFEGMNLCDDCIAEHTFICADCEKRRWTDDSNSCGDRMICQKCYDYNYTTCEDCGRIIHNDDVYRRDDYDDNEYCEYCYKQRHSSIIHAHDFKPEPIFYAEVDNSCCHYPEGLLMLGVENELDEGGEYDDNAEKLLDIANEKAEHLYIKRDGSLRCGFELVSHPMTLKYHSKVMPWKKIMAQALKLGYKSHDSGTCGLHVHVGREGLGTTSAEQDDVIARIVFFIEKFWPQLLKFSRRTEEQINRWAARYGVRENPKETLKHAKNNYARYVCLNLQNAETIEFRLLRGTLKYETFIAALQLVETICGVAISVSDEEMQNMTWSAFVGGINKKSKSELIKYLTAKGLFENEAVS